MKHKSKTLAPNAGLETEVVFAFDRVRFWVDRPELPLSEKQTKAIESRCSEFKVTTGQMTYQARWKARVELFQPTIGCLALMRQAMGNDVATLITYAESACDILAQGERRAVELRDAFLGSAKMLYQRQPVVPDDHWTTWYFGRRAEDEEDGKYRCRVLAVYADKPSKLNNARPSQTSPPDMHMELRESGAPALANDGIVSLGDVIGFNHIGMWDRHVRMYVLPRRTDLGRMLAEMAGADPNVSTTALRRRAGRWIKVHSVGGVFVMHNALLANPELVRRFQSMSFSDWLENILL